MSVEPFQVLTVCIGNICRSPLAELLLRLRLAAQVEGGMVEISSAGVGAVVGHPVDRLAWDELVRLGGSGEGFSARQITGDLMTEADLVLTATVDVRARALQTNPRALRRTFTLGEFALLCDDSWDVDVTTPGDLVAHHAAHRSAVAGRDLDVRDPIGLGERDHSEVADQIDGYVTSVAARLGPLLEASASHRLQR